MDQTDWQIIKVLFEEQNITKAAEKLFISQPALTYRIKNIEEKLGIDIIYREKNSIRFSAEGELAVKYAMEMIERYQSIKDQLHNSFDSNKGRIRIGVSTNFARFMLPGLLDEFLKSYSDVQFNVTTEYSKSLVDMIENNLIHLAIIRGEYTWEGQKTLLKREPLYVVSNQLIPLEELPYHSRIMFKTDYTLEETLNKWWTENFNLSPKIMMHIDNIETSIKLAEKGLGYVIVPDIGIPKEGNLKKTILRNKSGKVIYRNTWLLYKSFDHQYPILKNFINFIVNYFHEEEVNKS